MRSTIIDGYNVIRADPSLAALERFGLERARTALLQMLNSSTRLQHDRVIVVFDGGRSTRPHVQGERVGKIWVLYSAMGQTADDVVIAQAEVLSREGPVVVVSNDHAVREGSRAFGAEVSGSENMLNQMPGRRPEKRTPVRDEDDIAAQRGGTRKRGNPKRAPRRSPRQDFRF